MVVMKKKKVLFSSYVSSANYMFQSEKTVAY